MDDPAPALLHAWVEEGDQRALQALIESQQGMVAEVCRRVLGDSQSADDAVQDALVALSREAATIRGHPGAWLRRTALHAALRRKRELADGPTVEGMGVAATDPAAAAERLHRLALVDECVGRLSPADRDLIVAIYYRQVSQRELARHHGVSQARVSQRLSRTLEHLRAELRQRGLTLRRGALVGLLAAFGGRQAEAMALSTGIWWAVGGACAASLVALGLLVTGRGGSHVGAGPVGTQSVAVPMPSPVASPDSVAGSSCAGGRQVESDEDASISGSLPRYAVRPDRDGATWIAGGRGWDPSEWEVCLYGEERSTRPFWGSTIDEPETAPSSTVAWLQAVGERWQAIEVAGRQVVAFPMTTTGSGQYCGLRSRDARRLRSAISPVRHQVVLFVQGVQDWRWAVLRTDWVPRQDGERWHVYTREAILAATIVGVEPMVRHRVIGPGGRPTIIGDFHAAQKGVLMALPAVRLLSTKEVAELYEACRQEAGVQQ